MNFIQALRLAQIFGGMEPTVMGGGSPQSIPQQDIGVQGPGVYDIGQRMNQLYTPEHTASDKFNTMIDAYPQRPNPGIMRKIAAIGLGTLGDLGGGRGNEAFQRTMYGDYPEKVQQWKSQVELSKDAASLERQNNVNERTLAYQTVAAELRQQAQDAKEKNDAAKMANAEHRASIYEAKSKRPNLKFNFSGPTVLVTDPDTGEVTDTGVPTGAMSKLDQLNLTHENRMEEIKGQGEQTRETEGIKNKNIMGQIDFRGEKQKEIKLTPSPTTNKPELPTQTKVRQYNAAKQLYNTRPDLRPFIKLGENNSFEIEQPSTGFFGGQKGPNPQQLKEITDTIYGTGGNTPNSNNIVTPNKINEKTTQPITKQVRNKNTGEIRDAYSYDGGKTWTFNKR